MLKPIFTLLLLLVFCPIVPLHGQSSQCNTPETPRLSNAEVIEQFGPGKNYQRELPDTYLIPIVFYIFHNNQPFVIREGQVLAQLDQLNSDFAPHNIQFCLATQKDGITLPLPQGPTIAETHAMPHHPGIIYVNDPIYGSLGGFGFLNTTHETTINQYTGLGSDEYLKVFLLDITMGSYSYYPSTIPLEREAIYMSYRQFGVPGICRACFPEAQYGTFLAHEVGHFFNLYHVWDLNACGETNCQTQGDRVCDTPPINYPVNFQGCRHQNLSGCLESFPAFDGNYMDYIRSECMHSFSTGQVSRMTSALLTYPQRINLWSDDNHQQTGVTCRTGQYDINECAVTTNFSVENDPYGICQVTFTDQSWFQPGGVPSEWHWEFGDGTTSNLQHPHHQFPSDGNYEVCLTTHAITESGSPCSQTWCSNISVAACQPPPDQGCNLSVTPDIWPLNCYTEFRANVTIPTNGSLHNFEWNFGDGHFSSHPNTVHRYEVPGTFEVILSIEVVTATGEHCQLIHSEIVKPNCNLAPPARLGVAASSPGLVVQGTDWQVFPNPSSQQVVVSGEWDEFPLVELMDLNGRTIAIELVFHPEGLSFPVSLLPNGVYFLRLTSGSNIHSKLLIVQH